MHFGISRNSNILFKGTTLFILSVSRSPVKSNTYHAWGIIINIIITHLIYVNPICYAKRRKFLEKKLAFLAHTTIIHPDDYDDYVIVVGIKFR